MSRDVNGTRRVGMFDVIKDPVTGDTYTPVSGRGDKVTYKRGDGKMVKANSANMSPDGIRYAFQDAEMREKMEHSDAPMLGHHSGY